ncbi:MAG: ArgR family transcriptional regulator [Candidatus Dependentiae bacterium]|nr:ArgR family transcriptional regulator [Candidatus Dependentiae bacterium]
MAMDRNIDEHIMHLVQTGKIREQRDLRRLLKKHGFDIPQPTLSRRLKRLKIAKIAGVYQAADFGEAMVPLVLNMQSTESGLVVLHTAPGQASSLAVFLDQKYVNFSPDEGKEAVILGTIAGDDTVLLITKGPSALPTLLAAMRHDFPYLRREKLGTPQN